MLRVGKLFERKFSILNDGVRKRWNWELNARWSSRIYFLFGSQNSITRNQSSASNLSHQYGSIYSPLFASFAPANFIYFAKSTTLLLIRNFTFVRPFYYRKAELYNPTKPLLTKIIFTYSHFRTLITQKRIEMKRKTTSPFSLRSLRTPLQLVFTRTFFEKMKKYTSRVIYYKIVRVTNTLAVFHLFPSLIVTNWPANRVKRYRFFD